MENKNCLRTRNSGKLRFPFKKKSFPFPSSGFRFYQLASLFPNLKMEDKKIKKPEPGDGVRSIKTTNVFRALNFELYMKPNTTIMALGLIGILGSLSYIAYMRKKYEGLGYYAAIKEDGVEQYRLRRSNWD